MADALYSTYSFISFAIEKGIDIIFVQNGNRAGRIEPRAIKKRHNTYPLLMKTRDVARAEVFKNRYPKQ